MHQYSLPLSVLITSFYSFSKSLPHTHTGKQSSLRGRAGLMEAYRREIHTRTHGHTRTQWRSNSLAPPRLCSRLSRHCSSPAPCHLQTRKLLRCDSALIMFLLHSAWVHLIRSVSRTDPLHPPLVPTQFADNKVQQGGQDMSGMRRGLVGLFTTCWCLMMLIDFLPQTGRKNDSLQFPSFLWSKGFLLWLVGHLQTAWRLINGGDTENGQLMFPCSYIKRCMQYNIKDTMF